MSGLKRVRAVKCLLHCFSCGYTKSRNDYSCGSEYANLSLMQTKSIIQREIYCRNCFIYLTKKWQIQQKKKQINLYDATADEQQSQEKVSFLSLESK